MDAAPRMIPDLKLRHMGMFVRDIGVMGAFYCDVLGFVITDRGDVRSASPPPLVSLGDVLSRRGDLSASKLDKLLPGA